MSLGQLQIFQVETLQPFLYGVRLSFMGDSPSTVFLEKLHRVDGKVKWWHSSLSLGQYGQGLAQFERVSRIRQGATVGSSVIAKAIICETLVLKRHINELKQREMGKWDTLEREQKRTILQAKNISGCVILVYLASFSHRVAWHAAWRHTYRITRVMARVS